MTASRIRKSNFVKLFDKTPPEIVCPHFYKPSLDYVWYAGYGSNLSQQRFLCYIKGGKPLYGRKCNRGCTNKDSPAESRPHKIPHRLYFALPEGETETNNWGRGGVAFISNADEKCECDWTLGRIWKIRRDQYECVKKQEGTSWYDLEILLGKVDGVSIYTITNNNELSNIQKPSKAYLKTLISGLKETYNFTVEEIAEYLLGQTGIKGCCQKSELV